VAYYRGDDDDYLTSTYEGGAGYDPGPIDVTQDRYRYEGRFALEKDQPSPYGSGLPPWQLVAAVLGVPTPGADWVPESLKSYVKGGERALTEAEKWATIAGTITAGITTGPGATSSPSPPASTPPTPSPPWQSSGTTYQQVGPPAALRLQDLLWLAGRSQEQLRSPQARRSRVPRAPRPARAVRSKASRPLSWAAAKRLRQQLQAQGAF
jgi:hypothetical protein